MPKKELSMRDIKKLPPHSLLRMLNKAKKFLKTNEVMINICKEYGQNVDIIDLFPTTFGDIDVSATTTKGIVTLNYKLLMDGSFDRMDFSYLIHEYQHLLDQCFGKKATKSSDDGEYLRNKFEQKAFQVQVEYIDDQFGKEHAEDYVDNLLDHHEIEKKKDRNELEEVLLEKID